MGIPKREDHICALCGYWGIGVLEFEVLEFEVTYKREQLINYCK